MFYKVKPCNQSMTYDTDSEKENMINLWFIVPQE